MELTQLYFKAEKWRHTVGMENRDGIQSAHSRAIVLSGEVYRSDDAILDGLTCNYLINERIGPKNQVRITKVNLLLGSNWEPATTTELARILTSNAKELANGILSLEFGIQFESEDVILFERPDLMECKLTEVSYSLISNT